MFLLDYKNKNSAKIFLIILKIKMNKNYIVDYISKYKKNWKKIRKKLIFE